MYDSSAVAALSALRESLTPVSISTIFWQDSAGASGPPRGSARRRRTCTPARSSTASGGGWLAR